MCQNPLLPQVHFTNRLLAVDLHKQAQLEPIKISFAQSGRSTCTKWHRKLVLPACYPKRIILRCSVNSLRFKILL